MTCSAPDCDKPVTCRGMCNIHYQRWWRSVTPSQYDPRERHRKNIWRKYRMTLAQFDDLLDMQGGVCAICERTCATHSRLSVDHDHRCCPGEFSCGKCVRGLLCRGCNSSVRDNPAWHRSVVSYLEAFDAMTTGITSNYR